MEEIKINHEDLSQVAQQYQDTITIRSDMDTKEIKTPLKENNIHK